MICIGPQSRLNFTEAFLVLKRDLSITYILLLDKGGHVYKGSKVMLELKLLRGAWKRCRGAVPSFTERGRRLHSTFRVSRTIDA